MSKKPNKLHRALEYLEDHEGLGVFVILVSITVVVVAIILGAVLIGHMVNSNQCSQMCEVDGSVGSETSEGCVCAKPNGERWTKPTVERRSED